jgi:5-methylcytosine-specific restriction endonuclease McrA
MSTPEPERQVQFLFNVQRLLSDGSFVATYKYALLLSLADLAVERGDDTTQHLSLDSWDLAAKFVALYWRQVLPLVHAGSTTSGRLHQATGSAAAILNRVAIAHARVQGSLARLKRDRAAWHRLLKEVARTIEVMPLWKLQTVGGDRLDFLYPNVGKGNRVRLHGEAVYCLRRFRDLIGDMCETAWARFVRRLPRNHRLLGAGPDLREFLFGSDRATLGAVRDLLGEVEGKHCFYCGGAIRTEPVVDHFVPWARYPLDLGHNFVLAHARCNAEKNDRLAAFEHLERWCGRNARPAWTAALEDRMLPHDSGLTNRVAAWAYALVETAGATVWQRGRDGLIPLDSRWRAVLKP